MQMSECSEHISKYSAFAMLRPPKGTATNSMDCRLQALQVSACALTRPVDAQVFADERSAVIGGLPSEEDGEFFETAPAGPAALDLDAMERDASAPSASAPHAGAAPGDPWQPRQTSSMCWMRF